MARKEKLTHETERMIFPKRLRKLLEETKTTQPVLAEYVGCTRQAISLYVTGQSAPDVYTFQKIAEFFDVSTDYLLGLDDGKTHELEFITKTIGLSGRTCEILKVWNEVPFFRNLTMLNFIVEHGYKLLDTMYDYMFLQYVFADSEDAISFKLPDDATLYNSFPLVTFSKHIREGRSIINTDRLNDMHFGEIMSAIAELKKIADNEKKVNP